MTIDLNQDTPKNIVDKAYEAIEIAKKTGKIKKGINEVTKIIERGQAKLAVLAKDTNPQDIIMHIPALCEEKNAPLVIVPSKDDLGGAAGLQVGTSAVVILVEGDAKSLLKDLVKN